MYPKTGGVRRKFGAADAIAVGALLAKLEVDQKSPLGSRPVKNLGKAEAVDVDTDGWPTFGIAASPAASPPMSRNSSMVSLWSAAGSVASTIELDESGWPTAFVEDPAAAVEPPAVADAAVVEPPAVADAADAAELPPLIGVPTPNAKKRKTKTLANRDAATPTQKTAKAGLTRVQKARREVHGDDGRALFSCYASTTSEGNPRCEVRAHFKKSSAEVRRLHVYTLTQSKNGPKFCEWGNKLKEHINSTGCSKAEALEFLSSLS